MSREGGKKLPYMEVLCFPLENFSSSGLSGIQPLFSIVSCCNIYMQVSTSFLESIFPLSVNMAISNDMHGL